MPILFRTTCYVSDDGRPFHDVAILGAGTFEELESLRDADVKGWQAADRAHDDAYDEREHESWIIPGERYEAEPEPREYLAGKRSFVNRSGDGIWTCQYVIKDGVTPGNVPYAHRLSMMDCYAGKWWAEVLPFSPEINDEGPGVYLEMKEGCGHHSHRLMLEEAEKVGLALLAGAAEARAGYAKAAARAAAEEEIPF